MFVGKAKICVIFEGYEPIKVYDQWHCFVRG
jgi:hypothetical protein